MIVPQLKIQILCNDPNGKSGIGTTSGIEFHLKPHTSQGRTPC